MYMISKHCWRQARYCGNRTQVCPIIVKRFNNGKQEIKNDENASSFVRLDASAIQPNNIHILCHNDLDQLPCKKRERMEQSAMLLMEIMKQYINVVDQYDPETDTTVYEELTTFHASKLFHKDAKNMVIQVGSLHKYNKDCNNVKKMNQYPSMAHKNIEMMLEKVFHCESSAQLWNFSDHVKNQWNPIKLETICDYYDNFVKYCSSNNSTDKEPNDTLQHVISKLPTNWTLCQSNDGPNANDNSKSNSNSNSNRYSHLHDCFFDSMPYLQLKLSQSDLKQQNIDKNELKYLQNKYHVNENDSIFAEMLIFRDTHDKLSNLDRISNVCKEYKPDFVFLESCADDNMPIINKFHKKHNFMHKYLKFLNNTFSKRLNKQSKNQNNTIKDCKRGNFWYDWVQNMYFRDFTEMASSSYATNGLLHYYYNLVNNNSNNGNNEYLPKRIIMCDMLFDYVAPMITFSKYLDDFQESHFAQFEKEFTNIDKNNDNINSKQSSRKTYDKQKELQRLSLFEDEWLNYTTKYCQNDNKSLLKMTRLLLKVRELVQPHFTMMNEYRNNYMAMVLKSLTKELIIDGLKEKQKKENKNVNTSVDKPLRILCLWGNAHTQAMIDHLIGNRQTSNVFDEMNKRIVKLNTKLSKDFIDQNVDFENYWANEIGNLEQNFLKLVFDDKCEQFIQFCQSVEQQTIANHFQGKKAAHLLK